MPIDTFVMDPDDITDVAQVDDIISRIRRYKRGNRFKEVGVLLIQRRQFAALYEIVSKEEAVEYLSRPVLNENLPVQWGLAFYPLSYFRALRKRLSGNNYIELPEPIRRPYR